MSDDPPALATRPALHGIAAEFNDPKTLLAAARELSHAGFRKIEAYTPHPVEGLAEAIGFERTAVPLITLLGAVTGAATAYGMQFYSATIDYPINVGGRPLHSWPSFIPITFELSILFAALAAVLGMLLLNGLPRLNHPIFELPGFSERCHSQYFLCIEADDPQFTQARPFLERLNPMALWEVPG